MGSGMPSNTGVGCCTKSTSEIESLSDSILWTGLEMARNEKRKTSESEVDGDDGGDVDAATPVFKPGFFVPCHPILTAVIVYGLYLTVASALCPNTCLPDYLPIASFATSSGMNHPTLMRVVASVAVALHILEAIGAMIVARRRHNIYLYTSVAWGLVVFIAGIFAFWPLLFPAFFFKVAPFYCKVPATFCCNLCQ